MTQQDGVLLTKYVREPKNGYIASLKTRSRVALTPETIGRMALLAQTTSDAATVSVAILLTKSPMAFASAEAGASGVSTGISMPASISPQVATTAASSAPNSAGDASLVGVPPDRPWA